MKADLQPTLMSQCDHNRGCGLEASFSLPFLQHLFHLHGTLMRVFGAMHIPVRTCAALVLQLWHASQLLKHSCLQGFYGWVRGSDGHAMFTGVTPDGSAISAESASPMPIGAFTTVIMRYDSTSHEMQIWIDGIDVTASSVATAVRLAQIMC